VRSAGARAAGPAVRTALAEATAAPRLAELNARRDRFEHWAEAEPDREGGTARALIAGARAGQLLGGRLLEVTGADRVGLPAGRARFGVILAVGHDRQRRAVERLAGGQILRLEGNGLDHAGGGWVGQRR